VMELVPVSRAAVENIGSIVRETCK
jgi:hypothetical protein